MHALWLQKKFNFLCSKQKYLAKHLKIYKCYSKDTKQKEEAISIFKIKHNLKFQLAQKNYSSTSTTDDFPNNILQGITHQRIIGISSTIALTVRNNISIIII